MADMTKLTDLLTEITTSSTFTAEALAKFKAALDKAEQLESELTRLAKSHTEVTNRNINLDAQLVKVQSEEAVRKAREEAVTKREVEMTKLELRTAVAEAREGVRKEVFETIFRNGTIKRSVVESINGYESTPQGTLNKNLSNSTTETTTEE